MVDIAELASRKDLRTVSSGEIRWLIDRVSELYNRQQSAVRNLEHLTNARVRDDEPYEPNCLDGPTWGKVSHIFGVGSHSPIAMCIAAGVDPHRDSSKGEDDGDKA